MTENDSSPRVNRRKVLKMTSAAAVGSTALTGAASANPGQGKGGDGQEQGSPFLEPTTTEVNFCGCSSVCIGDLPDCNKATIVLANGEIKVEDGQCYSPDGKIVGVRNDSTYYCNPNTACSGNTQSDCDEVGTAPQLEGGRGCGD